MNDITKTAVFLGGGLALAVIGALSSPGAVEPTFFSDENEEFFPAFKDPGQATSLEVWSFNEPTGESIPFNVKFDKGAWTIPSHFDYPADAKTSMAKAAGLLIGLRKGSPRSDRKEDHEAFGVVDPTDESLQLKGRGTKVTLKDSAGSELGSLIIGKEIEGKTDMHYVRLPDKKRTYQVKLDADISTKFEDWIERDILKAAAYDIEGIVYDNYSVNEASGRIDPGEKLVLGKKDYQWTLEGLADDEEVVREKADELPRTVSELKIVGVRPKPAGLTKSLERAQGIQKDLIAQTLARHGYFLANDGKLYANEGDVIVNSNKGVRYTLRFGEIVYGAGEAVTSGKESDKPKKAAADANVAGPEKPEGSHRYLMITADFDEALLKKPEGTPLPKEQIDKRQKAKTAIEQIVAAIGTYKGKNEGKLPPALAALTEGDAPPLAKLDKDPWDNDYVLVPGEGDAFSVLSLAEDKGKGGEGAAEDVASDKLDREAALKKVFDDHEAFAKKVEDGKKEAGKLGDRFAPWYYVISAEGFDKLKVKRADLVKKKEKKAEGTNGDGDTGK